MRKRGQKASLGFTLIEILLVITILMGVAVLEMRKQVVASDEEAARAAGKQIAHLGKAVEMYTAAQMPALQSMTDPNCPVVAGNPNVCSLNLAALAAAGLLPPGWINETPWGSPYSAQVRRVAPPLPPQAATVCANATPPIPIGCPTPYPGGAIPNWQYSLQGIVVSRDPWRLGGTGDVRQGSLGAAAREAGPSAGVTQANVAQGLFGGWTAGAAQFPGILADGQLAYLTGTQWGLWSQFLRRDGTLPMMANLDVGGQMVNNLRDAFLLGPASNPINKHLTSMMPNWVFKGTYQAADGTPVPKPICPEGGAPYVKLLMQGLAGDQAGLNDSSLLPGGTPPAGSSKTQVAQFFGNQLANSRAKHGWNIWAEDQPAHWVARFRRYYTQIPDDAAATGTTFVTGAGLAEVYCYYGDE